MAQWQRYLDLRPEWDMCEEEKISVKEMAKVVSDRLKALKDFGVEYLDERKTELASEFEDLASQDDPDIEDFDELMALVYDWGDIELDHRFNGQKVCWIHTTI